MVKTLYSILHRSLDLTIFADRSIKSLKPDADWIRIASKSLPWIILIVILVHIFSIVRTFGFI